MEVLWDFDFCLLSVQVAKCREILMFVHLQKDAKQCCGATMFEYDQASVGQQQTSTMTIYGTTALFGITFETSASLAQSVAWLLS